jgi:hypothetical protein
VDYQSDVAWLRGLAKSGSFASTQPERVLARLLTMTDDPSRFGFLRLGGGYFGSVYSHKKTPDTVYKLCLATFGGYRKAYSGGFRKEASDGYAGWAQLCAEYQREHGKQDFLPHIKEIIHDSKRSVYVMDMLDEMPDEEGMGWAMFFNEFFETGDGRYNPEYDTYPNYDDHPSWDGLVAFRDWLADRQPSDEMGWDIHRFNIMMRGDIPVLTDPWAHVNPQCSQASALTRKLNNSLGITA